MRDLVLTAPDELRQRLRGRSIAGLLAACLALRTRQSDDLETRVRMQSLRRLARQARALTVNAKTIEADPTELNAEHVPQLVTEAGIGPIVAAQLWISWSHTGRIRSESAFAALAGASPLPASSGQTTRHRLNRGGDRHLNRALHQIMLTRLAPIRAPAPTPPAASPTERHHARSDAASSATSPDGSGASSNTPTPRRLGRHRTVILGACSARSRPRRGHIGAHALPRSRTASRASWSAVSGGAAATSLLDVLLEPRLGDGLLSAPSTLALATARAPAGRARPRPVGVAGHASSPSRRPAPSRRACRHRPAAAASWTRPCRCSSLPGRRRGREDEHPALGTRPLSKSAVLPTRHRTHRAQVRPRDRMFRPLDLALPIAGARSGALQLGLAATERKMRNIARWDVVDLLEGPVGAGGTLLSECSRRLAYSSVGLPPFP